MNLPCHLSCQRDVAKCEMPGEGPYITMDNGWLERSVLTKLPATGVRPKGAGGAAAPPRKNNLACRNENRAIVDTGMNILSEQKLEVC